MFQHDSTLLFFSVDGEMKLEFVFVSKAKVNAGHPVLCACVSGAG